MTAIILPTGYCFCGCGDTASRGAYFIAGHDRRVDKWLNEMLHGNTVGRLINHGYGPGGKSLHDAHKQWKQAQG